jgi:predicted transposase YbfD/YdcC
MLMPLMIWRARGLSSALRRRRAGAGWPRWTARRYAGQPPAHFPAGRHLLGALDHDRGVVLGQADVEVKTNEIPMLPVLLDKISLRGAIVTADAMHAQREHARYPVDQRGAHYILTVKDNQPKLRAQLAALPWRDVPATADTRERGHGRHERRTPKVTAVAAGLRFPHAAQAIQIVRRRKPPATGNGQPRRPVPSPR